MRIREERNRLRFVRRRVSCFELSLACGDSTGRAGDDEPGSTRRGDGQPAGVLCEKPGRCRGEPYLGGGGASRVDSARGSSLARLKAWTWSRT